jgi:glycosyltransferase involved in cell wall biosynthesis
MPLIERALAGAGVNVTVATTDDNGPGKHMAVPLGQELNGGGSSRLYFRKQTEFYKVSLPLWRWLRGNFQKFDLIHIHALFSFTSIAAARCARSRGIPYIIRPLGVLNRYGMTKRRPALKSISFRFLEKPLLRHAAAVHFTSQQEKIEAELLFQSRPSRRGEGRGEDGTISASRDFSASAFSSTDPDSLVIPLGLDINSFQKLPNAEEFFKLWPNAAGRNIILFLSRLDPKKGLDLLIDAFAELKARCATACLVIAGDGAAPFVHTVKQRAEKLGVTKDILWTGFLEGDRKLAAFAAAKIFVLPSYSENFGIAAVEALAAGVPTVLTNGVGIAPAVRENDAGLVVGPNAAEIAAAAERLLSDPALAEKFSANGRELARNHFSLEAMGAALKACYERIVNQSRKHMSGVR